MWSDHLQVIRSLVHSTVPNKAMIEAAGDKLI